MDNPPSDPSPRTQSLDQPFTIQAYAADGSSLPLGFDDWRGRATFRLGVSSLFTLKDSALVCMWKYVEFDPEEMYPQSIGLSQRYGRYHTLLFEAVKENEDDQDPRILRVAKPSGMHYPILLAPSNQC